MENLRKKILEKQGYRLVGNHSAIKICLWCKKSLKNEDVCYKNTFYGIKSWRCVQMTPILDKCSLACQWCWRDLTKNKTIKNFDNPSEIIEKSIEAQKEILQGFKGNKKTDNKKFKEAMNPKHFAISLTAEPTFYPYLPELISELHKRKITSFLVTNGTNPKMIKKLVNSPLTQLYITLPAPDKDTFEKLCSPKLKNAWKNIMNSLSLINNFKRNVVRLTLAKEMNLINPEGYSKIINKYKPKFLELKAAMPVGYARYRMRYDQMPLHNEIKEFAEKICSLTNYKIVDEKKESRVILLMEKDTKDRVMNF